MGAVNLGTSKVITLGLMPYENESDEVCYEDDFANVREIINDCDFRFFTVALKPGYYESFYLDIDYDLGDLEDFEEEEINAEIDRLDGCLLRCVNIGMQAYTPGWVTTWFTCEDSVDMVKTAISDLRSSVYVVIKEERNSETDVC